MCLLKTYNCESGLYHVGPHFRIKVYDNKKCILPNELIDWLIDLWFV